MLPSDEPTNNSIVFIWKKKWTDCHYLLNESYENTNNLIFSLHYNPWYSYDYRFTFLWLEFICIWTWIDFRATIYCLQKLPPVAMVKVTWQPTPTPRLRHLTPEVTYQEGYVNSTVRMLCLGINNVTWRKVPGLVNLDRAKRDMCYLAVVATGIC